MARAIDASVNSRWLCDIKAKYKSERQGTIRAHDKRDRYLYGRIAYADRHFGTMEIDTGYTTTFHALSKGYETAVRRGEDT